MANLTGTDAWPSGAASLFWALLAMVSSGEGGSDWAEVTTRLRYLAQGRSGPVRGGPGGPRSGLRAATGA